jgi:hypothetical protein
MATSGDSDKLSNYATVVADGSYDWYRSHAIRARRLFRISEVGVIVVSSAIPASVAIWNGQEWIAALLGAMVAVLTGLRSIFHWHENYLRFSAAREAVERERRMFRLGVGQYGDVRTREQRLVQAVSAIEESEMGAWLKVVERQPAGQ